MRKAGRVAKLGLVVDINGLQKRDTSSGAVLSKAPELVDITK